MNKNRIIMQLTKPFNTSTLHILIDTTGDLLEINKIMG